MNEYTSQQQLKALTIRPLKAHRMIRVLWSTICMTKILAMMS